jgi:hypothetical protein
MAKVNISGLLIDSKALAEAMSNPRLEVHGPGTALGDAFPSPAHHSFPSPPPLASDSIAQVNISELLIDSNVLAEAMASSRREVHGPGTALGDAFPAPVPVSIPKPAPYLLPRPVLLSDAPQELLLLMMANLPLVDKVSLSLTSKGIYPHLVTCYTKSSN